MSFAFIASFAFMANVSSNFSTNCLGFTMIQSAPKRESFKYCCLLPLFLIRRWLNFLFCSNLEGAFPPAALFSRLYLVCQHAAALATLGLPAALIVRAVASKSIGQ